MVYVTQFLLRWLYLNNILRDRADIQSLPQQQSFAGSSTILDHGGDEISWRRKCLHGILSYPPGSAARLLAIDSYRLEIVHQLASQLHHADETIQTYHQLYGPEKENDPNDDDNDDDDPFYDADLEIIQAFEKATSGIISSDNDNGNDDVDDESEGSTKDAVLVISPTNSDDDEDDEVSADDDNVDDIGRRELLEQEVMMAKRLHNEAREYLPQLVSAVLHSPPMVMMDAYINPNTLDPLEILRKLLLTRCIRDPNLGIELCWLLEAEVGRAWKTLFEHRQQTGKRLIVVLPAEKAAVIASIGSEKKSAFDLLQDAEQATAYGYMPHTHDHLHHHSSVTWKDHFKSNTAATLMMQEEFSTPRLPASLSYRRCSHFGDTMHFLDRMTQISLDLQMVPLLERKSYLHNSLQDLNRRLRRRMVTKGTVSLDVQDSSDMNYPNNMHPNNNPNDPNHYHHNNGWPTYHDVTLDMLPYSVHFPLEPKSIAWPPHHNHNHAAAKQGVMRVLNIVYPESRILASRERCPYLVHLEVSDTGYEGSDARLYAAGATNIGATMQEILGMKTKKQQQRRKNYHSTHQHPAIMEDAYHVPVELVSSSSYPRTTAATRLLSKKQSSTLLNHHNPDEVSIVQTTTTKQEEENADSNSILTHDTAAISSTTSSSTTIIDDDDIEDNFETTTDHKSFDDLRGGDQSSSYPDDFFVDQSSTTGYDWVRQEQLEQLHQQMQQPPPPSYTHHHPQQQQQQQQSYPYHSNTISQPPLQSAAPSVTTKSVLLDKVFGLPWAQKCEQIRQASPFGNVPGWRLASFIMKAGEDIRREALVMQVISKMRDWFEQDIPASNRPYLRPYTIMCIGGDAGLLECLPDAKSIDEVKKETDGFISLRDYFERAYGPPQRNNPNIGPFHPPQQQRVYGNIMFEQAQDNFLRSLVGYSLVCYILQIKDRHNANILLDREGHIMHIDFGFVLGDTPKMGKVPLFSERAPFKLTQEFWDVIGGWNMKEGGLGVKFCKMFEEAFACAANHADELATLIEAALLNLTRNPQEARSMANGVRSRLKMKPQPIEQKTFIMDLVNTALTSWGTSTYDWLQKSMNGYI